MRFLNNSGPNLQKKKLTVRKIGDGEWERGDHLSYCKELYWEKVQ